MTACMRFEDGVVSVTGLLFHSDFGGLFHYVPPVWTETHSTSLYFFVGLSMSELSKNSNTKRK